MTATPNAENATPAPDMLAAIDMGSNSFHMVVARLVHGEIRTVEKMGEKVQLGAGLDQYNRLTEAAQQRALECLSRFAQRLQGMPAAVNSMRVGMPRMLNLGGVCSFSSMFSLQTLSLPSYSSAISSRTGAIILHGPHHSAQ